MILSLIKNNYKISEKTHESSFPNIFNTFPEILERLEEFMPSAKDIRKIYKKYDTVELEVK